MCCSGLGKDGALRIVNSGIGINEAASIDLAGIKGGVTYSPTHPPFDCLLIHPPALSLSAGIWSLHCGTGSEEFDNTVILSFVEQTT